MTSSETPAAYARHLQTIAGRWEAALDRAGFDAAVIGAGCELFRHRDDTCHPFRPDPYFVQWIPLLRHPASRIVVTPGKKPELLIFRTDDYWHQPTPTGWKRN